MQRRQNKIDIFTHVFPRRYLEALSQTAPAVYEHYRGINPPLNDMEHRLRVLEPFEDVVQVLVPNPPGIETVAGPKKAAELAKIANDDVAGIVAKYPEKFVCGVAWLPMNDIDAAVKEAERAIKELQFRGVMVLTNIAGESLEEKKFWPLYALMAQYDLPIWIHPRNPPQWEGIPFHDDGGLSWPYQTSIAMGQLGRSGVFEEYPSIKFVVHHLGAMIPVFYRRAGAPIENLRKFYADTAQIGSVEGLMLGYKFFGADHVLFGSDMPHGTGFGAHYIQEAIDSIEQMGISAADKVKIFGDNARKLLKLPV